MRLVEFTLSANGNAIAINPEHVVSVGYDPTRQETERTSINLIYPVNGSVRVRETYSIVLRDLRGEGGNA